MNRHKGPFINDVTQSGKVVKPYCDTRAKGISV